MRDVFSLGVCLLLTHAVVVGVIRFIRPSVQPAGSPSSLSASVERLAHIERLIGSLDERLQHLDDQLDVMDRRLRRGLVRRPAATAAMVNAQPVNAEIPAVVPTRMPTIQPSLPRSSQTSGASPWLTSLLEDMQNPKPSAVRFVAAADEDPAVASSTGAYHGSDGKSSKVQQPSAGIAAATPILVPDGSTSQPLAKKPPAVASRKKPKPSKEEDWEAEWETEDKAERVQDSSSRSGTSTWGSNSLLEELAKLLGQQPGSKAKSKRRKAGKAKGKAKPGALTAGGDAAGEERDDDFVIYDVPE